MHEPSARMAGAHPYDTAVWVDADIEALALHLRHCARARPGAEAWRPVMQHCQAVFATRFASIVAVGVAVGVAVWTAAGVAG